MVARSRRRARGVTVLVGAIVATCSCGAARSASAGASAASSSAVESSSTSPSTSGSKSLVSTAESVAATRPSVTLAVPASSVAPLTGLALNDAAAAQRPALIVKIDGQRLARPQFNLERADLVIEEIVEGITRFMAVFHSDIPDIVGPVRSARTQDMLIAPMFRRPLFAWSGGNAKVSAMVAASPVVNLSATKGRRVAGMWFRTRTRKAPHNLLARGPLLVAQAPVGSSAPPQILQYRSRGATVYGEAVAGVKLTMSGTRVLWVWDPSSSTWLRTQDGAVHRANSGQQVAAANVVVLATPYAMSAADAHSPEAQTVGTGVAWIFTAGRLIRGTWTRSSVDAPWTLTDAAGRPILLTPGRTWIELSRPNRAAVVAAGVDPATVAYPRK